MLGAYRRPKGHGTHLGSRNSAFRWLGAITVSSKTNYQHSSSKSNNTSSGAPQHQLASLCAALPRGCRTRGTCWVGGSCPQLPARMEIPESPTRGAEQLGTVITRLSLIRLYCKFYLTHMGGSHQKKCISVKGVIFEKIKFYPK